MPELPEVETTRRGIAPHVAGRTVTEVRVRERRLRWPVPRRLECELPGQTIHQVERRAKYLLLHADRGTVIIHLGMSGSLQLVPADRPPAPHDHLDICFDSGHCLRLTDPRRFGTVLWTRRDPARHRLLRGLGPEPLGAEFTGDWLYRRSRGRRVAVKSFLMDSHIVAGIGNIYASEALFEAGIHPARPAGRISRARYERLAHAIKQVLQRSIRAGGTTLRDFLNGDGQPGYFSQQLRVYGRTGEPCPRCGAPIRETRIGQRSSCYCPRCQR